MDAKLCLEKFYLDALQTRFDWYEKHVTTDVDGSLRVVGAAESYAMFLQKHFGASLLFEQRRVVAPSGASPPRNGSIVDLDVSVDKAFLLMGSSVAVCGDHVILQARQLAPTYKIALVLLLKRGKQRDALLEDFQKVRHYFFSVRLKLTVV